MKRKILKNISTGITIVCAIIGIMTIALFAHEYSHFYDVKKLGGEVCELCVNCFGSCDESATLFNTADGWVKYYDNGNDIISSEIRAYAIQVVVAPILFFFMFKSQLFTRRRDK